MTGGIQDYRVFIDKKLKCRLFVCVEDVKNYYVVELVRRDNGIYVEYRFSFLYDNQSIWYKAVEDSKLSKFLFGYWLRLNIKNNYREKVLNAYRDKYKVGKMLDDFDNVNF